MFYETSCRGIDSFDHLESALHQCGLGSLHGRGLESGLWFFFSRPVRMVAELLLDDQSG